MCIIEYEKCAFVHSGLYARAFRCIVYLCVCVCVSWFSLSFSQVLKGQKHSIIDELCAKWNKIAHLQTSHCNIPFWARLYNAITRHIYKHTREHNLCGRCKASQCRGHRDARFENRDNIIINSIGLKLAICYFVDSVLPTARPKKIMTDQPKQTAGSPTNGLILRALNMILDNIVGQVYLQ